MIYDGVIEIVPGVLEKNWEGIEKKIDAVLPFASSVHIDLLDGKFAPNTSFADPTPFSKYKDLITLELHMMVQEPITYLESWAQAGFTRFIGQIEQMKSQTEFVAKAQRFGEVGLGIDSDSEPEDVKVSYNDLDFLFVMTVKAGFSHQSFLQQNLKKVAYFRSRTSIPIEIDGGVNDTNIADACIKGANRFVSTGYLFGGSEPKARFQTLHQLCRQTLER